MDQMYKTTLTHVSPLFLSESGGSRPFWEGPAPPLNKYDTQSVIKLILKPCPSARKMYVTSCVFLFVCQKRPIAEIRENKIEMKKFIKYLCPASEQSSTVHFVSNA